MTVAAVDVQPSPRVHHLPAAGAVVVATALLALLPVVGDGAGRFAAVVVLQLALVAAWVAATGIRGSAGSLALGGLASIGADLAVVLPERPELDRLLAVLGLGFLLAVVHQMTRPSPRRYLVASLAGVLLLLCCVSALAVLLAVARVGDGAQTAVLAVGAALLAGHLVDLVLPRPQIADSVPRGLPGLFVAVLAAVVVALLRRDGGALVDPLSAVVEGASLGGVAALMAVGASYVVAERGAAGWSLPVVQAVLPLAAAAPVAYLLALHGTG